MASLRRERLNEGCQISHSPVQFKNSMSPIAFRLWPDPFAGH